MFLLNEVESTLHDKPIEEYTDKQKYEKAFSECKKWRSLIKAVWGKNIIVISKRELDTVRYEYRKIVNASEISIGIE